MEVVSRSQTAFTKRSGYARLIWKSALKTVGAVVVCFQEPAVTWRAGNRDPNRLPEQVLPSQV